MDRWKEIEGYEGYYMVSDTGRIKALERQVVRSDGVVQLRKEHIKALTKNQDGYLTVNLCKDGMAKRIAVHILVAKAFVPGYFDGAEVNHKDCNRENNSFQNLEWVNHVDNIHHTINNGRHVSQIMDYSGANNPNYGNRKLHNRYADDKDYAKMKQSRPGEKNGRAKSVNAKLPDGTIIQFGTLKACAEYLVSHSISKAKNISCIATYISKAAKLNKEYCGVRFEF